uniref:Tubby C-terminal domain-containing protein n=1 Tax=Opuntia streptacantha TaxID=393608 RepID=A0A7C9EZQ9_OPUST
MYVEENFVTSRCIVKQRTMSFRSILQDMKGEFGSMSRKGFEVKLGHGFRSRSQRVVQDSLVSADALKQSCWANMPPELLRDVLMRIEVSEISWPLRRHVVACAGVCRSWREIMNEIVKTPEASGKLTFPISLKQPGARDTLIQCYIKRHRSSHTYYLFLGLSSASYDDGKFLLAARKCRRPTCTDYIISLNPEYVSKGSSTYIGKLRSNFLGTKFTIYDTQPSNAGASITRSRSTRLLGSKQVAPRVPAGNYPVAHISYELNVLGSRGPRRMQCVMDTIPASAIEPGGRAPTQTEFVVNNVDSFPSIPFFRSKSIRVDSCRSESAPTPKDGMLVLRNKAPRWHEQLQCWCLNFNGRVTVASVKNFQLVASLENGSEHENVILQFGKVGKDVFTMDYQYPISAFQAFAICLSSFDTKIACE